MGLRDLRTRRERAARGPGGVPPRVQRLAGDERGVAAAIFAITFSAIFLAVAVAIDCARTQTEVVRVQNALDAAALAASHRLGLPDQDATDRQDADAFFKVNTIKHKDVGVLTGVVMDADQGEVVGTAKGNMLTSLLKAVGIKTIGFGFSATVKKGRGRVEVALVLDNSGSMAGQPISDQEPHERALRRPRGHRQSQGRHRALRRFRQRRHGQSRRGLGR